MADTYQIPGLIEMKDGSTTLLRSMTTGTVVRITSESDGSRVFDMMFPAFAGHDEITESFDDIMDLEEAYVTQWVRWAAVNIGMGFHPDTSADAYEPPLDTDLHAEYDKLIDLSHGYVDPYASGLDAWEDAGIIPKSPNA